MGQKRKHTLSMSRKLVVYLRKREQTGSPHTGENELWQKIEGEIERTGKRPVRRYIIAVCSTAALLALFIAIGPYFYPQQADKGVKETALVTDSAPISGKEIILTTSSGARIPVQTDAVIAYSPQGNISVDKNILEEPEQDREQLNQIVVPKGKHTRLVLADGSRLNINAGSRVIYPASFKKDKREIYVEGEVFLDVYRDEHAPFIVKTAGFDVEVLGTAFNIQAYKDENHASVALVRGAVKIKDGNNKEIQLEPNELASIEKGSLLGKRQVCADEYAAWTKGVLILHDEPLPEVFLKLERYYGEKIVFAAEHPVKPLHGKLDLHEGLEEILRLISVTAPVAYRKNNGVFYVTTLAQ